MRPANPEQRILLALHRGVRRWPTLLRQTKIARGTLDRTLRRMRLDVLIYVQMVPLRKKPQDPRAVAEARYMLAPRGLLAIADAIANRSKLTQKDVEVLDRLVKKGLAKRLDAARRRAGRR